MDANFWNLILASKGDAKALTSRLNDVSDEDLVQFSKDYYQALINLNRWDIWGAGYVMSGGMSDDGFRYFRSWIIGKGEETYQTALNSPDDLGSFAENEEEFENEMLEYASTGLLEERELSDPRESFEVSADDDPEGEEWDEDSVYEMFPKLAKQFG